MTAPDPSPRDASRPEDWFARAYDDARRQAHRIFAGERAGHTLQPTALVHEAFLRWRGRAPTRATRTAGSRRRSGPTVSSPPRRTRRSRSGWRC